jgi:hypothetical protein
MDSSTNQAAHAVYLRRLEIETAVDHGHEVRHAQIGEA